MQQIPGMTPSLLNLEPGCAFKTRCPKRGEACEQKPKITHQIAGRDVRCHYPVATDALVEASS